MQYIKKDLGSFNLHMIKTNKFKPMTLRVIFHSPIQKEELTKRNVLSDILLQSSKKYSSKRNMIIESENLYAADLYNNTQRLGNYMMTSFILQVLNDRYTEKGNFNKAVEFLSSIIFEPDVINDSFQEEALSIVKKNCEDMISTVKEDPVDYAFIRLKEAYDKENPISYRMVGYKEDLDKIKGKNLYDYYKNMIENDFVDIFVVGDFEEDELLSLIKKNFKFRKIKKQKKSYEIENKPVRKRRLIAKEKVNATQSKMAIACPVGNLKPYEKNYPLVLGNIILGGGVDSKLFKEVREKNSLCYTIFSGYSKLDNMIYISAGIDRTNFDKTVDLTTKILEKMKKGRISDKDIKIAKEFYNTSITSIEESPMNLMREYIAEEIIQMEPYQERKQIMNKVTKKEIVRAMKKVNMDTIFLLEGEADENN